MAATHTRHLGALRLAAELSDEEEEHLAACLACRAERRLRLANAASAQVKLGPFTVLGEIGRGGMGQVLAVRDSDGRMLAVKLMTRTAFHRRFLQEAQSQPQVSHPHVLPIIAHLTDPVALVLPFVEGPTLARLLAEAAHGLGRALLLSEKLALFQDLVAGVAAIHEAGMVHRDLKPSNVLLDAAGERVVLRVADFGLIKAQGGQPLTRTGDVFGTPAYMAPEQSRDASRVDARADVYALGVILFELLTGQTPPPDASTLAMLPQTAWGTLARALLRDERSERPQDAREVWARLPETGAREEALDALVAVCRWLAPVPRWTEALSEGEITLPAIPNNLPAERDPFVDRDEVHELAALLGPPSERAPSTGARLVTVLGEAGMGKTRLMLAYARLFLEDWPGGIWLCDLAVVGATAPEALSSGRRTCVLLDGFDPVLPGATETLRRWMQQAAASTRFVVTARVPTGLPGEVLLPLGPLDPRQGSALFEHRARAVRDSFAPSPDDRGAIAALVARLRGVPRAIEQQAMRIHLMSPRDLLEEIDEPGA